MAFENLKKAGIGILLTKLKTYLEETYQKIADAVLTVNGNEPDEYGNVEISRVNYAGDLESSFTQKSSGAFLQRMTGGNASITNGDAWLSYIMGNSVHTGFIAEYLNMNVLPINEDEPISAVIDRDDFFAVEELPASPITLTYTTGWNIDPSSLGVTVTGTAEAGDQIVITYTREERGLITNANPTAFVSTNWNLFNQTAGYAKVVRYSDDYGYRISGTFTALQFSATLDGQKTSITPVDGIFQVPSDGYVWVTGGDSSSTAIYPTWSDWTDGYPGSFAALNKSVIDLSSVMDSYFPNGLFQVDNVRDELNISLGQAISRIERFTYSPETLASVIEAGRAYTYDEYYIYQVRAVAVTNNVTINGGYTADGHGIEYFEYESSSSPVYVQTIYGANLKNKLERDTLTISQQALDEDQKKQVRRNIGAPGADEVLGGSDPLFFWKAYSPASSISVNSNAEKTLTVGNFGITPIEGYTPMGIFAFTSGKSGLLVRRIDRVNDASSTAGLMVIRNVTGSTISSANPSITVLYIKSDIVTTAPEEVTA